MTSDFDSWIAAKAINPVVDRLAINRAGGNQLQLALTGLAGQSYTFQVSSNLFTWTPLFTGVAAPNGTLNFTTTNAPGVYRGKVDIEVGGEWQGELAYEGPAGKGKTTFSVKAQ